METDVETDVVREHSMMGSHLMEHAGGAYGSVPASMS